MLNKAVQKLTITGQTRQNAEIAIKRAKTHTAARARGILVHAHLATPLASKTSPPCY